MCWCGTSNNKESPIFIRDMWYWIQSAWMQVYDSVCHTFSIQGTCGLSPASYFESVESMWVQHDIWGNGAWRGLLREHAQQPALSRQVEWFWRCVCINSALFRLFFSEYYDEPWDSWKWAMAPATPIESAQAKADPGTQAPFLAGHADRNNHQVRRSLGYTVMHGICVYCM